MNHHKKRCIALAVSSILMSASVLAQAAQTFQSTPGDYSGFTAHYGNSFGKTDSGHTFDNKFYFTVTDLFTSTVDLTSSYLSTTYDLNITALQLVSYNPVTHTIIHTYTGSNDTVTGSKKDEWSLDLNSLLLAGSYYLEVKGSVGGTSGGSYGGTLNVSALPEPETYGMMLGGLGLLGFAARRRNRV